MITNPYNLDGLDPRRYQPELERALRRRGVPADAIALYHVSDIRQSPRDPESYVVISPGTGDVVAEIPLHRLAAADWSLLPGECVEDDPASDALRIRLHDGSELEIPRMLAVPSWPWPLADEREATRPDRPRGDDPPATPAGTEAPTIARSHDVDRFADAIDAGGRTQLQQEVGGPHEIHDRRSDRP